MDNYQVIHFNQPLLINYLSFLNIGKSKNAINEERSQAMFIEAFPTSIKPKIEMVLALAKSGRNPLVYFSLPFLDSLSAHDSSLLVDIKKAVNKGSIQLVGSCAYHSFSYLCSPVLFQKEVKLYLDGIAKHFESQPELFINTACIYDDQVAEIVESFGYKAIIATANPWHLAGKHSGQVYQSNTKQACNVLLSNGDGPDHFQISLINGYGSAYNSETIDKDIDNEKKISELFKDKKQVDHSVYAVSLPLSSPSWEHKIPDYTNNPLQKAFFKQCSALVNEFKTKLKKEDLKLLMLLCQPDHLLQINQTTKDDGYDNFISSMNYLTDVSLRYK